MFLDRPSQLYPISFLETEDHVLMILNGIGAMPVQEKNLSAILSDLVFQLSDETAKPF